MYDIVAERWRQIALRNAGKFSHTLADPGMTDPQRVAAFTEEVLEVMQALQLGDAEGLRTELVQVAAVCVAWCEYLDAFCAPTDTTADEEFIG